MKRFRYSGWLTALAVALLFVQLGVLAIEIPVALEGRTDFRAFYAAGHLIATGRGNEIYDYEKTVAAEKEVAGTKGPDLPYIHPAYEGLLFAGLAQIPYKTAFGIYSALSVGLLGITVWILMRGTAEASGAEKMFFILVAAAFLPVGICLVEGQDSLLLLAAVTGSYLCQRAGKEFAAGLVLGAAAFRFQLLMPVVVLLVFARRWKFVAGLAVTCAVAAGVSVMVAGSASITGYPRYLETISGGLRTDVQKLALAVWPTAMPNVRGLLSALQVERAGPWMTQAATAAGSVAVLGWAIWKRVPFEWMMVVAVLVSYHGNIHDSVLLLLPLMLMMANEQGKLPASWYAVFALPTVLFVLRVPFAFLAPAYLWFLVAAAGLRPAQKAGTDMLPQRA